MNEYVTDAHALLWHILSSSKLSPAAALIFKQTDENEARIYIPTIVLVETVYLIEKARVPKSAIDTVIGLLETQPTNYSNIHSSLYPPQPTRTRVGVTPPCTGGVQE